MLLYHILVRNHEHQWMIFTLSSLGKRRYCLFCKRQRQLSRQTVCWRFLLRLGYRRYLKMHETCFSVKPFKIKKATDPDVIAHIVLTIARLNFNSLGPISSSSLNGRISRKRLTCSYCSKRIFLASRRTISFIANMDFNTTSKLVTCCPKY